MDNNLVGVFRYLSVRNDYVIWAGMAAQAHVGIQASADVDIFTSRLDVVDEIADYFSTRGWDKKVKKTAFKYQNCLRKEASAFDVIYSEDAAQLLFDDRAVLPLGGSNMLFVSKEWLLLTKLGQFRSANRPLEKRERDLEAITKLSQEVDTQKIMSLIPRLTRNYWDTGWL
jgi:hypothetical protein